MTGAKPKKILTLSPYVTSVPTTGGTKRIHYLNRGLARVGWQVQQVSCSSVAQGFASMIRWEDMRIEAGYREAVYFNPLIVVGNRLLRATGSAQTAATLLPRAFRPGRRIVAEIARHQIVLFEHPQMFDMAAPHLRDDHLVVLDAHNIESNLFADRLDSKGLAGAGARALRAVEQRCMERADLVFTCSPFDRDSAIAEFGVDPATVHLAPNGVDIAETPFVTDEERAQAKLRLGLTGKATLFVGSLWGPNIEAALKIVEMAPARPEITYLIVGAVGKALPAKLPSNIKLAGFVDDLRPWLAAADLAVNPMVSGSGSNVKIFEYLAAGLPTVSTSFGARGIDDPSGQAVALCELCDFPERIVALAASEDLADHRRTARELAVQTYDWSKIAANIAAKIEDAMEEREL
jgi:glycosyltransferase involved in cell wall biosynthesis